MLPETDQEQRARDEQFKNGSDACLTSLFSTESLLESDELWATTERLSRELLNIEQKTFQAFCVLFGLYGYEQAAASWTNPLDVR